MATPTLTATPPDIEYGPRVVDPADLLGVKQAAEIVGADRTTVSRWHREGYFPRAWCVVAGQPVWIRPDVERWLEWHRERSDGAGRRPWGEAARAR